MTAEQSCSDIYHNLLQRRRSYTGNLACDFSLEELGIGLDSTVYRVPNAKHVVKFYNAIGSVDRPTYEQVKFYMDVTNVANMIFERNVTDLEIPNSGDHFRVRVVPYMYAFESSEFRCVVGICPYAAGLSLYNIEFSKTESELLDSSLKQLSLEINTMFGLEGVRVARVNLKLTESPTGEKSVYITDLCTQIGALKKTV